MATWNNSTYQETMAFNSENLMEANFINLNDQEPESNQQSFDWMQLNDLKNGRYSFGFWNVIIKNSANGQQYLQHDGICKTNTFEILHQAGFYKRYRAKGSFMLIRAIDNILDLTEPSKIKDFALDMIDTLPDEIEVCGFKLQKKILKEKFMDEHAKLFTQESLTPLKNHTAKMMTDSKTAMFFPFLNGVAKVTTKGVELVSYADLKNVCIWRDHIIKRDFVLTDDHSMFSDFVCNVSGNDPERIHAVRVAMGYLMHRYYTPVSTKAVVLYDEKIADRDSAFGRTGKGITVKAIEQLREVSIINGKRFDPRDRFALQNVTESTEVVFLDDVLSDFDFEYFNSILTDGWEFEHKNKTTIRIPVDESPKLVISANQIMKTKKGETASGRQFILEFSDFYSSMLATTQTPIVDVHGCELFREWDVQQWQSFDNYMLESCRIYLEKGLPVNKTKNVAYNRLLQATSPDFVEWIDEKKFQTDEHYLFGRHYQEFKDLAFGEQSTFGSKTFGNWLKLTAESLQLEYKTFRFNDLTYFKFQQI